MTQAACHVFVVQEPTSCQQRAWTQGLRRNWGLPHTTASKPNPALRVPPAAFTLPGDFLWRSQTCWPLSITLSSFFVPFFLLTSLVNHHRNPHILLHRTIDLFVSRGAGVGGSGAPIISINCPKAITNKVTSKDILGICCAPVAHKS